MTDKINVAITAVKDGVVVVSSIIVKMHLDQMATDTIVHEIKKQALTRPANWLEFVCAADRWQFPGQGEEIHRALQRAVLIDSIEVDSVE